MLIIHVTRVKKKQKLIYKNSRGRNHLKAIREFGIEFTKQRKACIKR
jgi:hypothetical protein